MESTKPSFDELAKHFTAKYRGRYDLTAPFVQNGLKVVTNARVMVFAPCSDAETEGVGDTIPNISGLAPRPDGMAKAGTVEVLKREGGCPNCGDTGLVPAHTEEDCEECGGTGTVECDHCGSEVDCEECHGEGVIELRHKTEKAQCPVCHDHRAIRIDDRAIFRIEGNECWEAISSALLDDSNDVYWGDHDFRSTYVDCGDYTILFMSVGEYEPETVKDWLVVGKRG